MVLRAILFFMQKESKVEGLKVKESKVKESKSRKVEKSKSRKVESGVV
jgi:hypothetical protein